MGVVEETGERLTRFRAQAGLDPEAAAAEAHIAPERLAAAEGGQLALTDDELGALARVYGVDVTEIFGGRITPFRDYAGGV
jgi:transcriptional regulator with XRE-family HTH domain